MANDNKNKPTKPKFNPYWIYGIIIAVFLGIQLFSGGGMETIKSTTPAQFLQYLEDGDVAKIEIVNKYEAKVYLTKEADEKEVHKKSKSTSFLSVKVLQIIHLNLVIYKILKIKLIRQ